MIERMQQDESRREPELGELLDLGNFQEAIELLVEKPLRALSADQRTHVEAGFCEVARAVASVEANRSTWQAQVDGRLEKIEETLQSERNAATQREATSGQAVAAVQSAVTQLQQSVDELQRQHSEMVSFAEANAQQVRAAADRDRLSSRILIACLGVLLVALLVIEMVRT